MPKKSAPVRGGAQRSRPKTQKSFELVRPTSQELEEETLELDEQAAIEEIEAPLDESTTAIAAEEEEEVTTESTTPVRAEKVATRRGRVLQEKSEQPVTERAVPAKAASGRGVSVKEKVATEPVETKAEIDASLAGMHPASKMSASARLAARRQAGQRAAQRSASALITTEHYAYVRKDLIFIAILAVMMFTILIVLYFIPGITL